jgi:hypothetical protein
VKNNGFTSLELCIVCAVLAVLMGSALGVFGEMTYFLGNQNTMAVFAIDSSCAFSKMEHELRKIGNTNIGGVDYPQINGAADTLSFVRLAKPPCLYDGNTELQWDPTVYTAKVTAGELAIWQGTTKKLVLCRNVQAVNFALSGRKLAVDLTLQGMDPRGQPITQNVRRIIILRN